MDVYTYERICKEVKSGIKHMILNTETNVAGVIDLGEHGFFNVKVGDGEEVWPLEKCAQVDVEETKRTGRLILS